jgi:nucleoside-diphosphate-sugar epimerase
MTGSSKTIFIFGLGYVGLHLAEQLSQQGWQIIGTTRTPENLSDYQQRGWTILPFSDDKNVPDLAHHLVEASALVSTITAISGRDPVIARHKQLIEGFAGWTGYVSATSIYPDQAEGWVDETTTPEPATARGRARWTAEQEWGEATGAEIFRVAGIYGPKRSPFAALREGRSRIINKPGHFFNRIHQDDISRIIIAAMTKPRRHRIINLCDNEPAAQADVIRFAAELIGVTPPVPVPFEEADLTPMARTFYISRRRVRSVVREPELGIDLRYPNYRSGLRAILDTEEKL